MVPLRRAFKRRGQRSPQSWLPFTVVLVVTAFNTKFAFSLEVTHFFYYCADRQKLAPSFLFLSFFPLFHGSTLLYFGKTTKGKKVEARCQQSMNSRGQTSDCKKQRQKGKERKKERKERTKTTNRGKPLSLSLSICLAVICRKGASSCRSSRRSVQFSSRFNRIWFEVWVWGNCSTST